MSSGNIPDAAMLSTMHQTPAEYNANSQGINFVGTYLSPNAPLWASAIGNLAIGPDILVSTIGMNSGKSPNTGGFMRMDISGVGGNYNPASTSSGKIIFKRTPNYNLGAGAVLSMDNACIVSTISNTVFDQIPAMRYELGTSYDDLGVGNLYLYGANRTLTQPPIAALQDSAGALNIVAPNGVLINGAPAGTSANPSVSSLTVKFGTNPGVQASITLQSPSPGIFPPNPNNYPAFISFAAFTGNFSDPSNIVTETMTNKQGVSSINTLSLSGSAFANSAVLFKEIAIQGTTLNPNTGVEAGYIYAATSGVSTIGTIIQTQDLYVSSLRISTINGVVPGAYVPPENFTASSIGVQTFSAYTAGISSITGVSTINGAPLGVATLPADAVLSTLTMNRAPGSQIYLQGSTINVVPSISSMTGAKLLFDYALNANNVICVKALANVDAQLGTASFVNGLAVCDFNLATSNTIDFVPMICRGMTFGTFLADYNSPAGQKFGAILPTGSGANAGLTITAPNLNIQGATTMGALTATSMIANSLSVSTLNVSSIVNYIFTVSSVNASSINAQESVTVTNQTSLLTTSTMNFNASAGGVNLGGIDLGMGGFLGGLTGQLVSGALTTTISGLALGTGIAGLILPRSGGNPPPGGNVSSFTTINGTTQLQFSTIGANTSSFYRFTAGADPTLTPAAEVFISSIVAPGTVCLRSFSDPINPANPSSFTSTLQSFGQWVPIPLLPGSVPANIVASTITLGVPFSGASIATSGFASINGVSIGANTGAVAANTLVAGTGVSQATMSAGGAITGTSIFLNGAKTVNCGAITCTTMNGSANGSLGGCTFGLPAGQFTATTVNATNVNATNITNTGYISTIGTINTSGNINQTGSISQIQQTGLLGTALLQSGVLTMTALIPNTVTINNNNTTQTLNLTVLQTATISSMNASLINGGAVLANPPIFNSSATIQVFQPLAAGGSSYFVNVPVNAPCIVRINASPALDDGINYGASPIFGAWDIVVTWWNNGFGVGLRGTVSIIASNGLTIFGGAFTNPGSGMAFNLITSTTMNKCRVSYFISNWV